MKRWGWITWWIIATKDKCQQVIIGEGQSNGVNCMVNYSEHRWNIVNRSSLAMGEAMGVNCIVNYSDYRWNIVHRSSLARGRAMGVNYMANYSVYIGEIKLKNDYTDYRWNIVHKSSLAMGEGMGVIYMLNYSDYRRNLVYQISSVARGRVMGAGWITWWSIVIICEI